MGAEMLCDPQVVTTICARNRNDFHVRIKLVKLLDCLDPFLFRHDEIRYQDVEGRFERRFQSLPAMPRFRGFVPTAFEHTAEHKPDVVIVIDHQNAHRAVRALRQFASCFARHIASLNRDAQRLVSPNQVFNCFQFLACVRPFPFGNQSTVVV